MRKSAQIHSCALRILSGVRPRNCGVSRSRIASSGYRPNHTRGGGGGLFSDFALGGSEVAAFLGTLFLGVLEGRGLSTGM